jgi:hypothetical protein
VPGPGGAEVVVLGSVLVAFAVVLWGIVDAAGRPAHAWSAAGQSKAAWIALQAAGLVFCVAGFVLSVVYLAAIRPKVRAGERPSG